MAHTERVTPGVIAERARRGPGGSGAQSLAQTFVVLADALVAGYDQAAGLDGLVATCLHVLDASAAGVLLRDQHGSLSVASCSSESARRLQLAQLEHGLAQHQRPGERREAGAMT